MFKHQFIELIKQPKTQLQINQQQLAELDALIKAYPFFQSAYLLYTKGLHSSNAINYTKQLRKTAIVANSRGILYELLHQKNSIVSSTESKVTTEKIKEVEQKNIATETKQAVADVITEPEKTIEKPVNTNPVTITNNDIKVVYINTVPAINIPPKAEEQISTPTKEPLNNELNILKDVENETTSDEANIEQAFVEEQKLTTQIETEISRGIIQSYIETDIIKTPELDKVKEEKPLSFTDWLEKVKKESGTIQKTTKNIASEEHKLNTVNSNSEQPISNSEINNTTNSITSKKHIIDKIIEADPGRIKLGNQKFFTPQQDAKQSLLENEHLVTETLAKIYALQGNNAKAIRAYEILSLKFPQKSVYFASLIEKLKSNK